VEGSLDGWHVNEKRVYRIWRREGLKVPMKQPKRGRLWLNDGSCIRLRPMHTGHVWSYDFVQDRTHDGKVFRMLYVIDEFTRECLAIRVERKLNSRDVLDTLSELFVHHGPPEHIRSDNGPEFIATALREWLGRIGVKTLYIEPGSPWENGYCESFNSKLRDELLAREIFFDLREAKVLIETWRRHYNTARPHSSLGYRPPHKPSCPRRSYCLTVRMWRHERRYVETAGLTLLVDHLSGAVQISAGFPCRQGDDQVCVEVGITLQHLPVIEAYKSLSNGASDITRVSY